MPRNRQFAVSRDHEPGEETFQEAVVRGLSGDPKSLPCKYIYDAAGSKLFDQICGLPEYYPTRTESAILKANMGEIRDLAGQDARIIELGCGSVDKVRLLLDGLDQPASYVAVDISCDHLMAAVADLARDYPALEVNGVCADFMGTFDIPESRRKSAGQWLTFFPGSTIGNFDEESAVALMQRMADIVGPGGDLLIGADLKKNPEILHAAYNDEQEITAAFNRNLLTRINRELDGDFDVEAFDHYAFYEPRAGRIEMHLISSRRQVARAAGREFAFDAGETIHTENSYKYTIHGFQALAARAGFKPLAVWTDEASLFSIQYFRTEAPRKPNNQ